MSSYWISEDWKAQVKTIEGYFLDAMRNGVIDHALRVSKSEDGNTQFYIHPANTNGETIDYKVDNNTIWPAHEAFNKPDEKITVFLKDKGRMFHGASLSWYFNRLDDLLQAVRAKDFDAVNKIVQTINEEDDEYEEERYD